MILTDFAVKFRNAVLVFMLVITLLGVLSYARLPREGAPDITIPYVFVTALYEGTAPQEMENLVAIPIEKKLADLEQVKQIKATVVEGVALLVVEFLPSQDIDTALQKVKNKIDLARPDLPADLDEPAVDVINFSTAWPICMIALAGDTEISRLRHLAENLQDRFEALPGVKEAQIFGTREREIRIEVDLTRLTRSALPMGALLAAIAKENSNISAGNLEIRDGKFQVRIPGEFNLAANIRDIVVAAPGGKPIYLRDVAEVVDTYKDLTSISRLNGSPCVSLHVKKRSGENTVQLVKQVRAILDQFPLPPGIRPVVTLDQSVDIELQVMDLENNIFAGFVLVFLVLLVCMGGRASLFVGLSIPLSMLMSFMVLDAMGITLNMIVLFSLVLALGMLVDNAIVVTENIYRHRSLGESRIQAATAGASEVAWPVITSTLTTIVAFWPLLHWPSIIGQFMSYLPKTLIITLTASLLVGIMINPALASLFMRMPTRKHQHDQDGEIISHHPFITAYERTLRAALRNRGLLITCFALLLIVSVLAYAKLGKGLELFPDVQPRRATVAIQFPQGTSIEKTDDAVRQVEKIASQERDVEFFLANVGYMPDMDGGGKNGTQVASLEIEFVPIAKRTTSSMRIVEQLRQRIGRIPGADIVVDRERMGPPPQPPVSLEIAGTDFAVLSRLATAVRASVANIDGLVDLKDNFEEALPEVQFRVNRQKAALFGLNTAAIGDFLRTSIYGASTSKFRAGEDEYDITVRLPLADRSAADLFATLFIPTGDGRSIPLSSLGDVVYTAGQGEIKRKNQKRVITIVGDIQHRSIDAILADVRNKVAAIQLPPGYSITYSGENADMKESGAFLTSAFGLALALIAIILVIQFNSAAQTLIIMASVLLSLIGVMWGLILCGMRFSIIMTGLGVISLAGVVVNNAIVLLDCVNKQRAAGLDTNEAIVAAGRLRLRPVLLTAVTTVLGLIPMAAGWSLEIHPFWPPWKWRFVAGAESSSWWAPMAVAVSFGLTVATILTLIVVPVLYSLVDALARRVRRLVPADD